MSNLDQLYAYLQGAIRRCHHTIKGRSDPIAGGCRVRRVCTGVRCACIVAALGRTFREARALRICDDPNNLPFSNDKGEGFENKIAEILARKLSLPLEVFHYPQRINIVRNTLRFKLPNESDYRCDLLTGVPSDFTAVATTRPYFRSLTRWCTRRAARSMSAASSSSWRSIKPSLPN
jgi:hypothetical protein